MYIPTKLRKSIIGGGSCPPAPPLATLVGTYPVYHPKEFFFKNQHLLGGGLALPESPKYIYQFYEDNGGERDWT